MAKLLFRAGHADLLRSWAKPGTRDAEKKALVRAAARRLSALPAAVHGERAAVLQPPEPRTCDAVVESPFGKRPDPYGWMRDDDRADAEVLAHLDAENAFTRAALTATEPLQATLFAEMKGRIQEADRAPEVRRGKYYHYTRTREGGQYRVHCRRRIAGAAAPETEASEMDESVPEEILLDEDEEAKAHDFYMVGGVAVSDDDSRLAYSEDVVGAEKFKLTIVDLATGKRLLSGEVANTSGQIVWAADNRTILYVLLDKTLRPYKVMRLNVEAPVETAECVYQDDDEAYYVSLGRSHDRSTIFVSSSASMQNEEHVVPASDPAAPFTVLAPRTPDVDYSAERWHDSWVMTRRTKDTPNSELFVAPHGEFGARRRLIAHADDAKIEDFAVFDSHLALLLRRGGQQECRIHALPESRAGADIELGQGTLVPFEDEVYAVDLAAQNDFESPVVRLCYSSLARPRTWIAVHMTTGARAVKKVTPVLGGFDQSLYKTRRLWATSHDGAQVPISVVYNSRAFTPGAKGPLHLYAYGAYEINVDPDFSSMRLSLLDRGAAFAIAHVRGGGDMGRLWYERGKFLDKPNTFKDVIAVAEKLVSDEWTSPARLTLEGRSAGGMTVAAVANMRPDLFNGIVMGVPFVDCLTTMLDESIPLTVMEYEEWGNPADKAIYECMLSYSPIDNVRQQKYPAILVTAGLHDPRVAYWEPAKYVATLRRIAQAHVLLKVDLGAGHFSLSGRFDRLKETALDLAFTLKQLGLA